MFLKAMVLEMSLQNSPLVCITQIAVEFRGSSGSFLVNATGGRYPLGIASGSWAAAYVLSEMIQILIQEVFGYHTVVSGLSVRVAVLSRKIAWIAGRGQCLSPQNKATKPFPTGSPWGLHPTTFEHAASQSLQDPLLGPLRPFTHCWGVLAPRSSAGRASPTTMLQWTIGIRIWRIGKGSLDPTFPRVGTWCLFSLFLPP